MLYKWNFVLNTKKNVKKKKKKGEVKKKCRYNSIGQAKTRMYLHEWSTPTNYALPILPLNCFHFIYLYNAYRVFGLKDSLNSDLELNSANLTGIFVFWRRRRLLGRSVILWPLVQKEQNILKKNTETNYIRDIKWDVNQETKQWSRTTKAKTKKRANFTGKTYWYRWLTTVDGIIWSCSL